MILGPAPTTLPVLDKRQLWNLPTRTATTFDSCPPVTLASGGVIVIDASTTITFASNHLFQPNCAATDGVYYSGNSAVEGNKAPFYASTTVLIYVVATATVIAWLLLILLLIAPGPFAGKPTPKTSSWFRGRAVPDFVTSGASVIQFGSRPWLQKAAALLVTIALTIASSKTFDVAEQQYNLGYMDAGDMRDDVVGSVVIRVLRVVSDIFIWLAQVQTLIRLFPRRKEKLIIKWFGFLLILLDTVFASLNSFYVKSNALPRWYSDAIPALSYLFQLSISLLYGAWVCYYVATKRRYAFVNKDMPNITIISTLAIVSILIPVGFFVADVSVPVVAGWGDFFRWVGAVAASVLVWEWVERIEFLETEEKKCGILGREIFEEDEMFDGSSLGRGPTTPSHDHLTRRPGNITTRAFGIMMQVFNSATARSRLRPRPSLDSVRSSGSGRMEEHVRIRAIAGQHKFANPPPSSSTPISRTGNDTPSTVYDVQYHPITITPPAPAAVAGGTNHALQPSQPRLANIAESATTTSSTKVPSTRTQTAEQDVQSRAKDSTGPPPPRLPPSPTNAASRPREAGNMRRGMHYATSIFKRGKRSPPLEVKRAMSALQPDTATVPPPTTPPTASVTNGGAGGKSTRALKKRVGRFVRMTGDAPADAAEAEREREPTVIPAPPRGHMWSPDAMRHSPVTTAGGFQNALAEVVEGVHRVDGEPVTLRGGDSLEAESAGRS